MAYKFILRSEQIFVAFAPHTREHPCKTALRAGVAAGSPAHGRFLRHTLQEIGYNGTQHVPGFKPNSAGSTGSVADVHSRW